MRVITPTTASMRRGVGRDQHADRAQRHDQATQPRGEARPDRALDHRRVGCEARESTSPVFKVSKNCGLWHSTCA
jgi:hypothetical protein